jgi:hypothetical protein
MLSAPRDVLSRLADRSNRPVFILLFFILPLLVTLSSCSPKKEKAEPPAEAPRAPTAAYPFIELVYEIATFPLADRGIAPPVPAEDLNGYVFPPKVEAPIILAGDPKATPAAPILYPSLGKEIPAERPAF